jgi:hypothetical protein
VTREKGVAGVPRQETVEAEVRRPGLWLRAWSGFWGEHLRAPLRSPIYRPVLDCWCCERVELACARVFCDVRGGGRGVQCDGEEGRRACEQVNGWAGRQAGRSGRVDR